MSAPAWKSMSASAYRSYRKRAKSAKTLYDAALRSRYKPNAKTEEIIGLQSATFTHITTDAVPGTLTLTTFDTTSRADSAQILMTNSTGSSKVIIAAWIRGKPVTRRSGSKKPGLTSAGGAYKEGRVIVLGGYVHDKYVDYEAQARDGDITFETGNNFTVTADQVNKLADYYWKLNKSKKHIYTLSLVGFQSWYEPGEWYDLEIGGAGEAEYIDSVVECFDVRCSIAVGGAPYTSISFREVEEDWKFDSNETARLIASGGFNRRASNNVVTVAAQYYSGYADYYCDGTADQEEINSAISYLSVMGGSVQLTKGAFGITSAITMASNVSLSGEGAGTIVRQDATNIATISIVGTPTTSISNVSVIDLQVARTTGITSTTPSIQLTFSDNITISGTLVSSPWRSGISCDTSNNSRIINNTVDGLGVTSTTWVAGIYFTTGQTSLGNIVEANIIKNLKSSDEAFGIYIFADTYRFENELTNNTVSGAVGVLSSYTNCGIKVLANNVKLNSNYVTGCKNIATTSKTIGIYITTNSTNCHATNNYCYNNGNDTGLDNANSNNFYDGGTDTQWAG